MASFSLSLWVPGQGLTCGTGHWLSLSLWVPGQGLTCGTGHWTSESVSSPYPASLKGLLFCRLLLDLFSEFSVADGLRPSGSKDCV